MSPLALGASLGGEFLPNRPRDQDCTIQIICVGTRVDIDTVVCGYVATWMENFRTKWSKIRSERDFGGFWRVGGGDFWTFEDENQQGLVSLPSYGHKSIYWSFGGGLVAGLATNYVLYISWRSRIAYFENF